MLPSDSVDTDRIHKLSNAIYDFLDRQGIQALVRLVPAKDPFSGARQLIETYGLGTLVPNTIMLGASQEGKHLSSYCDMIRHFHESRRNTMIVRLDEEFEFRQKKRIDVWWGGQRGNGGLMLILAYLLQTSLSWRGSRVRVKMIVPSADAAEGAAANLSELVDETRTGADTEVLVSDGRPFPEILRDSSRDTDLVFLGMAPPSPDFESYYEGLQARTAGLPSTVFVLAAEDLEFEKVIL